MSNRSVSMLELNGLLLRSGHSLWTGDVEDPTSVEVWPRSDLIVTVACGLDECQLAEGRDRYFATLVDDDRFPILRHHPDFALPESFGEAAALPRRSYGAFMGGPFRWLVRRLIRFPHLLLWPENQIRSPDQFMRDHWVLEEMPRLKGWLSREPSVPPTAGALILDPSGASDCQVLWEAAEQVEQSFYNYYVSDPDGAEVYLLHHHSKVIVSIPDECERRRLLNAIADYPDLLEDCSGYESEVDDEGEEDAAPAESGPPDPPEET
jgi:hypothetical protein